MRKVILFMIIAAVCGCSDHASEQAERNTQTATNAPRMECTNLVYDFGSADNRTIIKHSFEIANTGTEPLIIYNVRTDCGCTAAAPEDRQIAPGQRSRINATLDLKDRIGDQEKHIEITSNDPEDSILKLTMKGIAEENLQIIPPKAVFGVMGKTATHTQSLDITSKLDRPFSISNMTSYADWFHAELETIESNRSYRLNITTIPPLPSGTLQGTVTLQSDYPVKPEIEIEVAGKVYKELELEPEEIILFPGAEPGARAVLIKSNTRFDITKVTPPDPLMGYQLEPLPNNEGYRLQIDSLVYRKELIGKTFIIESTLPNYPEIKIPFGDLTTLQKKKIRQLPAMQAKSIELKPDFLNVVKNMQKPVERHITLRAGTSFEITEVQTPNSQLNYTIVPLTENAVQIQFHDVVYTPSLENASIQILTTLPNHPQIELPINIIQQ